MYGYHVSVARTVLWFSDEYIRTKTWEYLKKAFGEALYIAPIGFLVAAKVSQDPRREKVNLTTYSPKPSSIPSSKEDTYLYGTSRTFSG